MIIFFILVLTVLSLMWGYVGVSLLWGIFDDPNYHLAITAILLVTIGLQIWRILNMRNSKAPFALVNAAYFSLGLFCQLFVATLTQDFLSIFYPSSWLLDLCLVGLAFLINWQSLRIAKRGPKVEKVLLNSGQTKRPLRIVQISDLHVGPIIQEKYVDNVVNQIQALDPDILVATGDIGDGDPDTLGAHLAPFNKIPSSVAKFYIPGNHEYYWNAEKWIQQMEKVGFKELINKGLSIHLPEKTNIWLGGVPDPQGKNFYPSHKENPQAAINGANKSEYKILLAHQPKSCFAAKEAGFDLMLCGHTHGGQFFPFTLLVGFFNPYSRGLNDYLGMKVYVNIGTGFWGPPMRLGARAEITSIEIS